MSESSLARIGARQHRIEQSHHLAWTELGEVSYDTLQNFPITPLSRLKDSVIQFPSEWLPSGNSQRPGQALIKIPDLPEPHNESLRRILLALWIVPRVRGNKGIRLIAPKTFIDFARKVIHISLQRSQTVGPDTALFKSLSLKEIQNLTKTEMDERVFLILHDLGQRHLIEDAPNLNFQQAKGEMVEPLAKKVYEVWRPFSDEFVSELGKRCIWLVEQAGPLLLSAYTQYLQLGDKKWRNTYQAQQIVIPKLFNEQNWNALTMPFEWNMAVRPYGDGKRSKMIPAWPPQSWNHVRLLMVHLQAAHYVILALSTGARWSETASLQRDCLNEKTLTGKTFKMSGQLGGTQREWVLPEPAIKAIKQQSTLASLYDGEKTGPLWVQSIGRKQVFDMNLSLRPLVDSMGLTEMAGRGGVHTHRWRKTIARLGALTISGAPKALMDLFGHRSVETTLGYMLSDPEMAAEIDATVKARSIMMAKEIIQQADTNTGQAAPKIKSFAQRIERGENALGVSTLDEAVEILFDNGRGFTFIRPGVLCTKAPGDFGPCTKSRGRPDPARCSITCMHRLETSAARKDALDTLKILQEKVLDPKIQEQPILLQSYQGQIRAHLARLKDPS